MHLFVTVPCLDRDRNGLPLYSNFGLIKPADLNDDALVPQTVIIIIPFVIKLVQISMVNR